MESALVSHEAVVEAAVTGVPDEVRGQAVKATIVLGPDTRRPDELTKELQNHVKKVTAPYKYPRVVVYVDETAQDHFRQDQTREIREQDNA